jgi:hypothetical protein
MRYPELVISPFLEPDVFLSTLFSNTEFITITVFCDMTPCCVVYGYQRFGGTYCLHFRGRPASITLNMKAAGASETLVSTQLHGVISLNTLTLILIVMRTLNLTCNLASLKVRDHVSYPYKTDEITMLYILVVSILVHRQFSNLELLLKCIFCHIAYNLKVPHSHHVCSRSLTNNILWIMCRYNYVISMYQITHSWLQWFISYGYQTGKQIFIPPLYCYFTFNNNNNNCTKVDSNGFWRWCTTLGITTFLDFVHRPVF